MNADPIRGRTLLWTYADGPVAGKTFEHVFGADGTVRYRETHGAPPSRPPTNGKRKEAAPEKSEPPIRYESARVSDDVHAVSYLAPSGWTLTTVLDLRAGTMVSFASNEKSLVVQRGTFEAASRT